METGSTRRSASSRSKSRTPTGITSSSPMSPCRDLSPSGVTSDKGAVDDISNLPKSRCTVHYFTAHLIAAK